MTREQKQHILHFAVSSLGGFMGGYAIYNHCDVFGNAPVSYTHLTLPTKA